MNLTVGSWLIMIYQEFPQRASPDGLRLSRDALGVSFYLFLSNYQLCMGRLRDFYNIISPFVAAFVVAFLLNAPMTWIEQKVFFKLKRKRLLAVLVTYVLALLIMGGLVIAVLPEVGMSAVTLIENLPAYLESIGGMVSEIAAKFHLDLNSAEALVGSWEEFVAALVTAIQKLIPQFIDFSVALGNGIINTVMALIVSVYMLVSKDTLKRQCTKATYALFPAEQAERIMQSRSSMAPIPNASMAHMALMVTPLTST